MLILLSPAKTLDYESDIPPAWSAHRWSRPQFVGESGCLVDRLKALSAQEVAELMELSPALAQLNVDRFQAWRPRHSDANSRPALLAFNGDVYEGLDAKSLSADDIAQAESRVLVLSGLYGVLRPLDRLQPYRLEMGRPLVTERGGNLYAFWGDRIAAEVQRRVSQHPVPLVLNLASQEYFKAARRKALVAPVLDVVFEDDQGKGPKVISFFAKRARGLMARWVLQNKVDHPDALRAFASEGYAWVREVSTASRLVFRRQHAS
jgi:cytoplasmic iron level regulating protein YaaA (DUF328/UPF0246 family)